MGLKSKIKVFSRKAISSTVEWDKYPAGEVYLKKGLLDEDVHSICANLFDSDSIFALMLYVDALKNIGVKMNHVTLSIPYIPYGRQDRVGSGMNNSSLSLRVFCDLINSMGFGRVVTTEPHSDVTPALLRNVEVYKLNSNQILSNIVEPILLCPDQGARKRCEDIVKDCYQRRGHNLELIYASKNRNMLTGNITSTTIDYNGWDLNGENILIFDDICDGGRTFIEIAKVLKKDFPDARLHLMVVHGLFTKGKEELYNYFETVTAYNDYSE